jgi:thiol-disulfide isomerase/thioredoxin
MVQRCQRPNKFMALILNLSCILGVLFVTGCSEKSGGNDGPQRTAQFFDAKFDNAQGKPVDLSGLRGKTVVLNFWATWCPPCVAEMPMFDEVQAAYHGQGVVFVGIATDNAAKVRQFLQTTPVDYHILIGGEAGNEIAKSLGNRYQAVPFTVIINSKQEITKRHVGLYTRDQLVSDLKKALTQ